MLHAEGLDAYVIRRLDLRFRDVDWTSLERPLDRVRNPVEEVVIALSASTSTCPTRTSRC